ncbi:two-component signal transduction response regulator, LytTR family [Gottschalkia acidurici 9a]|uniref:Two-component signal transduction response regulator, LytTR family n=1 Tax=Gottschalkia acidurici (strain ATCC 7906 / DSM 604 / BCRC 14475 / CIP 104303 / KCTC 5404 / NCIMB 10678 / 9a) TaxID=1128398 RepID=K0AV51_GOTA9|nr:LytTR family DNA-binding domain-containing protein [Gottschalkia acidurici]AFS77144.1 two-component signal transduction response regulator, LytTR family [Gottschalkia acidurici 9a]
MIKIAICEDEEIHRTILKKYLDTIFKYTNKQYEIIEFKSGEELLKSYEKDIDIILLDILMDKLTGMDVARKIREFDNEVEIIFITSLVDYIQDGYEVRAYRYLLKPINKKELKKHMLSCISEIIKNRENYIFVQEKGEMHKILVDDITYIEILRKDMTINTVKTKYKLKMTLKSMEKNLSKYNFFRCHKSYLVNMKHIQNLKQDSVIVNNEEVPVSRHRMRDFKTKLAYVLGEMIC